MKMKRLISAGLIGAMTLSTLAFTGCGSNSADGGDTAMVSIMTIMRTTRVWSG